MSFITRGFSGRSRERDDRLPPGQTLVGDFPVENITTYLDGAESLYFIPLVMEQA